MRVCQKCNSKDVYRTSRRTVVQFAASMIGLYPYVCRHCKSTAYHLRLKQALVSFAVLGLFLMTSLSFMYVIFRFPMAKPARSRVLSTHVAEGKTDSTKSSESTALINLPNVLTNEDVVEYAQSGMAPKSVSWLIRSMPHRFKLDAESLARLKLGGVTDEVIWTMTEGTPGVGFR